MWDALMISKSNLDFHAKLNLCFSTMLDAAMAEEKAKETAKEQGLDGKGAGLEGKGSVAAVGVVAKSAGGGGGGVSHAYNGTKAATGAAATVAVAAEGKKGDKAKKGKKGEIAMFDCPAVDEARNRLQMYMEYPKGGSYFSYLWKGDPHLGGTKVNPDVINSLSPVVTLLAQGRLCWYPSFTLCFVHSNSKPPPSDAAALRSHALFTHLFCVHSPFLCSYFTHSPPPPSPSPSILSFPTPGRPENVATPVASRLNSPDAVLSMGLDGTSADMTRTNSARSTRSARSAKSTKSERGLDGSAVAMVADGEGEFAMMGEGRLYAIVVWWPRFLANPYMLPSLLYMLCIYVMNRYGRGKRRHY